MSFYISIIGIDGSGKSTVTPALANLLAAELSLTTIAVGDDCWGHTPRETLFQPGFKPQGELLSRQLGRLCRRAAKAATAQRRLYPPLKLAHLALQEQTARRLARIYQPEVIISDGNLLLSAAGRAINYSRPTLLGNQPRAALEALYDYVAGRRPATLPDLPGLKVMHWLYQLDKRFDLALFKWPEAVILLELEPATALNRLRAKNGRLDPHENLDDLTQAQSMYRSVVDFFQARRLGGYVLRLDVTQRSISQTLASLVDFVADLPIGRNSQAQPPALLGSSDETLSKPWVILKKALNYRYLARYVLPNLHRGSAHELTFPLSKLGREFFKEGYSAKTMRAIYRQDPGDWLDKIFLAYPLHRAVRQRLQILRRLISQVLQPRLLDHSPQQPFKILSAPSGYAFDLLGALQEFSRPQRQAVHLIASDLDPAGDIEVALRQSAQAMALRLTFLRGDLTVETVRAQFRQSGPYDLVLFIGLSSWIAKPDLLDHLRLIHDDLLQTDGLLISDCFTPQAFALSGKYIGYKANYYTPQDFTTLLAYCGFDPAAMTWQSGPAGINHVCAARHKTPKLDIETPEKAALAQIQEMSLVTGHK